MKTLHPSSSRGFTLTEVLISTTIVGFAMLGVMVFYVMNLIYQFTGEQKLLINDDVRKFSEQLMSDARDANFVVLYQAFYPYTTANNAYPYSGTGTNSTSVGSTSLSSASRLGNGSSGDYIVFISYTDPFYGFNPANSSTPVPSAKITRLVAYWIAPNRNYSGETALYKFDTDWWKGSSSTWTTPWGITLPTTIASTNAVESLLPSNTQTEAQDSNFQIVLNDIRGLSNDGQGLNFTNYSNVSSTSILMRSRILHGNAAKRVTDTYNFTITPRG